MKTCLLLISVFFTQIVFAQWTDDPNNPLVISDAPGQQRYTKVLDDGVGGWYLFWQDARVNESEFDVYGQHLDENGIALWTPNGKEIINPVGVSINKFDASVMNNGEILLLFGSQDGPGAEIMQTMMINNAGDHVWNNSILVAEPEGILMVFHDPLIQANTNGAIISYRPQIIGGQYQTRVDHISLNGTLQWGINGHQIVTTAHGPIDIMSDGLDGAILHWRNSNGGGTHMGVMRVSPTAQLVFGDIVDPVVDSDGLYWDYRAISDSAGGLIIAFVETGGQIKLVRLDGNGQFVFTPNIKPVASYSSIQDLPRLTMHNSEIFVSWQDNRPPAANRDLYIQKLNMNGDFQYASEGLLAIQGPTYIPYQGITKSNNSSIFLTQLMSGDGLIIQRINNDGSAAWTEESQICSATYVPFYGEYELVPDQYGGAVCIWYNQDNQDLFASRIDYTGSLGDVVGIDEYSKTLIAVYPNPSDGIININNSTGEVIYDVSVFDLHGKLIVSTSIIGSNQINLSHLKSGVYNLSMLVKDKRINYKIVLN